MFNGKILLRMSREISDGSREISMILEYLISKYKYLYFNIKLCRLAFLNWTCA